MVEVLIVAGVLFAAFVGVNIGGSSTGASFGPSVGANIISKVLAGSLMTVFVFVGGWTIGRNVIHTLSEGIVPASVLTLRSGVIVLFVIGFGLLIANLVGIPASTSETAVGAIVGLGLATGTLNRSLVGSIVVLWVVSPLVAMGIAAAIGRFAYPWCEGLVGVDVSLTEPAIDLSWAGGYPRIEVNAEVTRRRGVVIGLTIVIGCYMAFSAGANNIANAIAPLVGEGALRTGEAVLLATAAIGVGAFTLARRTLETVGNDLAELQLTAALVVEVIAATVIATLSVLGVPASLAITTTGSIIGLNWGRQRRRIAERTVETATTGPGTAVGAAAAGADGGGSVDRGVTASDGRGADGVQLTTEGAGETELLDADTTRRTVFIWVATPTVAAAVTFLIFRLL